MSNDDIWDLGPAALTMAEVVRALEIATNNIPGARYDRLFDPETADLMDPEDAEFEEGQEIFSIGLPVAFVREAGDSPKRRPDRSGLFWGEIAFTQPDEDSESASLEPVLGKGATREMRGAIRAVCEDIAAALELVRNETEAEEGADEPPPDVTLDADTRAFSRIFWAACREVGLLPEVIREPAPAAEGGDEGAQIDAEAARTRFVAHFDDANDGDEDAWVELALTKEDGEHVLDVVREQGASTRARKAVLTALRDALGDRIALENERFTSFGALAEHLRATYAVDADVAPPHGVTLAHGGESIDVVREHKLGDDWVSFSLTLGDASAIDLHEALVEAAISDFARLVVLPPDEGLVLEAIVPLATLTGGRAREVLDGLAEDADWLRNKLGLSGAGGEDEGEQEGSELEDEDEDEDESENDGAEKEEDE